MATGVRRPARPARDAVRRGAARSTSARWSAWPTRCSTTGADGLVALATTAEASSLDERERDAVVAVCARVAAERGAALIVGAGTNDTRTTIARHEALADGRRRDRVARRRARTTCGPREAAIVAHFQAVAARSPVPLVVYNIPYRTGRGLGAAGAAGAGGDRRHRRRQAGRRRARRRHAASCWRGARRTSPCCAATTPSCSRSLLMGGAGAIAASAHLCTERFAALIADGQRRPPRRRPRRTPRRCCRSSSRSSPSPARRCSRRCCTTPGGSPRPTCACRWPPASPAALARARRSAPARSSAPAPARAR